MMLYVFGRGNVKYILYKVVLEQDQHSKRYDSTLQLLQTVKKSDVRHYNQNLIFSN